MRGYKFKFAVYISTFLLFLGSSLFLWYWFYKIMCHNICEIMTFALNHHYNNNEIFNISKATASIALSLGFICGLLCGCACMALAAAKKLRDQSRSG